MSKHVSEGGAGAGVSSSTGHSGVVRSDSPSTLSDFIREYGPYDLT